jgi:hypothetical protein
LGWKPAYCSLLAPPHGTATHRLRDVVESLEGIIGLFELLQVHLLLSWCKLLDTNLTSAVVDIRHYFLLPAIFVLIDDDITRVEVPRVQTLVPLISTVLLLL